MNKAVMLSIQPKWCELIASGKKTVEVRKTRPSIETPFKCYIYATKPKTYSHPARIYNSFIMPKSGECGSGRVVGEFVCDRIDTYQYGNMDYPIPAFDGDDSICEVGDGYWIAFDELDAICLTYEELEKYGKGAPLYGWHISDLVIYDTPRELGEFARPCDGCDKIGTSRCTEEISPCRATILTRPPQSWQFVQSIMGGRLHFEEV